jgi:uncharacterized peroxidase-related enzyme
MRLTKPSLAATPWYLKPFFWRQRKKYGQALVPALVWAKVPALFITVSSLYGVLTRKRSPLSPLLRSLITVRVSQINGCHFCVDINSATLTQQNGCEEKLAALDRWQQSDVFSALEKAVLDYTEKMTRSDQRVTDDCFTALKAYFSEKTIIELTALVGFQNLSSKFNSALDMAPQGFCQMRRGNINQNIP